MIPYLEIRFGGLLGIEYTELLDFDEISWRKPWRSVRVAIEDIVADDIQKNIQLEMEYYLLDETSKV